MVYETVPAVDPLLVMVCVGIFPVPEAVKPVVPLVLLAVQLKVVPVTFEIRVTAALVVPEQIDCVRVVLVTRDLGYTVIT
jgi:hypothetical protein